MEFDLENPNNWVSFDEKQLDGLTKYNTSIVLLEPSISAFKLDTYLEMKLKQYIKDYRTCNKFIFLSIFILFLSIFSIFTRPLYYHIELNYCLKRTINTLKTNFQIQILFSLKNAIFYKNKLNST